MVENMGIKLVILSIEHKEDIKGAAVNKAL